VWISCFGPSHLRIDFRAPRRAKGCLLPDVVLIWGHAARGWWSAPCASWAIESLGGIRNGPLTGRHLCACHRALMSSGQSNRGAVHVAGRALSAPRDRVFCLPHCAYLCRLKRRNACLWCLHADTFRRGFLIQFEGLAARRREQFRKQQEGAHVSSSGSSAKGFSVFS